MLSGYDSWVVRAGAHIVDHWVQYLHAMRWIVSQSNFSGAWREPFGAIAGYGYHIFSIYITFSGECATKSFLTT